MPRDPAIVTASEISDWAYCPESLRLSTLGAPSANQPARDAGMAHHEAKATAEVVAGGSIRAGTIILLIGALALAAALLWR